MNEHTDCIYCIEYCSALKVVISGSRDKTARVWDAATGKFVRVLTGHKGGVMCAAVHGTT
jgi:WD40 repeat protein